MSTLLRGGDYIVNGVDSKGTYIGHLTSGGALRFTYQSTNRLLSLDFDLKKK